MCHIKNLSSLRQEPSQGLKDDFEAWFESISEKPETMEPNWKFGDLLVPVDLPAVPSFVGYPSPIHSGISSDAATVSPLASQETTPEYDINTESLKRKRQNDAAKRCRKKKNTMLQESSQKIAELEKTNFELSLRLAVLDQEKVASALREKEMQARIDSLRTQLDEAHMILMKLATK